MRACVCAWARARFAFTKETDGSRQKWRRGRTWCRRIATWRGWFLELVNRRCNFLHCLSDQRATCRNDVFVGRTASPSAATRARLRHLFTREMSRAISARTRASPLAPPASRRSRITNAARETRPRRTSSAATSSSSGEGAPRDDDASEPPRASSRAAEPSSRAQRGSSARASRRGRRVRPAVPDGMSLRPDARTRWRLSWTWTPRSAPRSTSSETRGKTSARAKGMNSGMTGYEMAVAERKKALFARLFECLPADREATVVEVGMGTFPNAPY